MLYFSEILNKKVVTEYGSQLGKLKDLIFLAKNQPNVTKIVIEDNKENKIIIPIQNLKNINSKITIQDDYETVKLVEDELFVVKNLLDKQIIDIKGNKVVRVNDVVIQDKPVLYVAGVDIGILGILRWFKLEEIVTDALKNLGKRTSEEFLSWGDIQPIELTRGKVQLKEEEEKLEKVRPEDLADHLERTNIANVDMILKILDEDFAAEVIGNLNINYQTSLFRYFDPEKAAKIISLIDPDEATDILLTCAEEKREKIINLLSDKKKEDILYLLELSKTPIGQYVTSEFFTVSPYNTVNETIEKIRNETVNFSSLDYGYVINEKEQLVGVFNLHELLLQKPNIQVFKFMNQNVIVAHLSTPEEIVIKKILKYKLQALPVIDENKEILGIITLDDITEFLINKIR